MYEDLLIERCVIIHHCAHPSPLELKALWMRLVVHAHKYTDQRALWVVDNPILIWLLAVFNYHLLFSILIIIVIVVLVQVSLK